MATRRAVASGLLALTFGTAAGPLLLPSEGFGQSTRTQVRVGYVPVIGASALYVLGKAGWAKEAGLDIALTKFDSGPAAIQALASGTLDVLAIGVAPVAVAHSKGLDVKVVSAAGVGGSLFVATTPLAEAFASADNNPARAFPVFRKAHGRPAKIATLPPGAVPTTAFQYWLRTNKVDPADLEIVQMGIEATQQAMLAGALDGGQVLEPAATIVQARDPRLKGLITAPQMFPELPGVVMAATGAFAREHEDALVTFLKLVVRATKLIKDRPDEAAAYVQGVLGGGLVDTAVLAKALRSPAVTYETDPRAIIPATQKMLAFQTELGDFPQAPKTEGLFDTRFYDRAVADK